MQATFAADDVASSADNDVLPLQLIMLALQLRMLLFLADATAAAAYDDALVAEDVASATDFVAPAVPRRCCFCS